MEALIKAAHAVLKDAEKFGIVLKKE